MIRVLTVHVFVLIECKKMCIFTAMSFLIYELCFLVFVIAIVIKKEGDNIFRLNF
jgi:hypothetical protein